jgi:hypothetical protein
MASDRGWTDRRMDVVIGSLLRSGVVLSALIVLFGGEEVTFCRCGPSSRTLPEPLVSGYDFIEAVRGSIVLLLSARSQVVITPVNFFTYDREVGLRSIKRIGLPRKIDRWNLNFRLHLARRTGAREPEMLGSVLVLRGFAG